MRRQSRSLFYATEAVFPTNAEREHREEPEMMLTAHYVVVHVNWQARETWLIGLFRLLNTRQARNGPCHNFEQYRKLTYKGLVPPKEE